MSDINSKIQAATAEYRSKHHRHPAMVTADRLADAVDKWRDLFQPHERDAIGQVISALEQIAEGERSPDA